jgi:hypothetical protein
MLTLIFCLALIFSVPLSIFCLAYLRYRRNKKYPISEDELRAYLTEPDMQHEVEVRRQWLISYCVFAMTTVLLTAALWRFVPEESYANALPPSLSIVSLIVSMLYTTVPLLIGYYFAYRKRGTIWLFLTIILTPPSLCAQFFKGVAIVPEFGAWGLLLYPVLGIEVWVWMNCIRLRGVNALRRSTIKLARKHKYFQKEALVCV